MLQFLHRFEHLDGEFEYFLKQIHPRISIFPVPVLANIVFGWEGTGLKKRKFYVHEDCYKSKPTGPVLLNQTFFNVFPMFRVTNKSHVKRSRVKNKGIKETNKEK